jgi:hypothetical protein
MEHSSKYTPETMSQFCSQIDQNYSEMFHTIMSSDETQFEDDWYSAHMRYIYSLHDRMKYYAKETEKIKNNIKKSRKY